MCGCLGCPPNRGNFRVHAELTGLFRKYREDAKFLSPKDRATELMTGLHDLGKRVLGPDYEAAGRQTVANFMWRNGAKDKLNPKSPSDVNNSELVDAFLNKHGGPKKAAAAVYRRWLFLEDDRYADDARKMVEEHGRKVAEEEFDGIGVPRFAAELLEANTRGVLTRSVSPLRFALGHVFGFDEASVLAAEAVLNSETPLPDAVAAVARRLGYPQERVEAAIDALMNNLEGTEKSGAPTRRLE